MEDRYWPPGTLTGSFWHRQALVKSKNTGITQASRILSVSQQKCRKGELADKFFAECINWNAWVCTTKTALYIHMLNFLDHYLSRITVTKVLVTDCSRIYLPRFTST